MPEPYAGELAHTVLRGLPGRNLRRLLLEAGVKAGQYLRRFGIRQE